MRKERTIDKKKLLEEVKREFPQRRLVSIQAEQFNPISPFDDDFRKAGKLQPRNLKLSPDRKNPSEPDLQTFENIKRLSQSYEFPGEPE